MPGMQLGRNGKYQSRWNSIDRGDAVRLFNALREQLREYPDEAELMLSFDVDAWDLIETKARQLKRKPSNPYIQIAEEGQQKALDSLDFSREARKYSTEFREFAQRARLFSQRAQDANLIRQDTLSRMKLVVQRMRLWKDNLNG